MVKRMNTPRGSFISHASAVAPINTCCFMCTNNTVMGAKGPSFHLMHQHSASLMENSFQNAYIYTYFLVNWLSSHSFISVSNSSNRCWLIKPTPCWKCNTFLLHYCIWDLAIKSEGSKKDPQFVEFLYPLFWQTMNQKTLKGRSVICCSLLWTREWVEQHFWKPQSMIY